MNLYRGTNVSSFFEWWKTIYELLNLVRLICPLKFSSGTKMNILLIFFFFFFLFSFFTFVALMYIFNHLTNNKINRWFLWYLSNWRGLKFLLRGPIKIDHVFNNYLTHCLCGKHYYLSFLGFQFFELWN